MNEALSGWQKETCTDKKTHTHTREKEYDKQKIAERKTRTNKQFKTYASGEATMIANDIYTNTDNNTDDDDNNDIGDSRSLKFIAKCVFGYNLMRVSSTISVLSAVPRRRIGERFYIVMVDFDDDNDEKKVVLSVITVLMVQVYCGILKIRLCYTHLYQPHTYALYLSISLSLVHSSLLALFIISCNRFAHIHFINYMEIHAEYGQILCVWECTKIKAKTTKYTGCKVVTIYFLSLFHYLSSNFDVLFSISVIFQ